MRNLRKMIIRAKNIEQTLIEETVRDKDIAFFITKDIQEETASLVGKILKVKIKPSKRLFNHPIYTIEGKNVIYIGFKI